MDKPGHREVADFEHDILPDASKYIRLVEVLEGNHSKAFEARFRMSTWRIDGLPPYNAISYTWGDPEPNTSILINGKTFRVRKNCEFALKQAWWYKSNSYYWIDAICINQDNDGEKSNQVAMMGNIYKTTCKVLACVGDHADDSLFLYRHLAWHNGFSESLHSRDLLRRTHKLLTVRRYLHAAVHFAKRSYFSRLWILQELRNARQANVLCGADALPKQRLYRLFRDSVSSVIFGYPGHKRTQKLAAWTLRALFYRLSTWDYRLRNELDNATFVTGDSSTVRHLLWQTDSLHCTQRRDRIYGILSIFDWGEIAAPIPDYTKSDFEVALDCVTPMFELTRGEESSELVDTCSQIAGALKLSVRSDSVSGALEARRGAREGDFAGFSMPFDPPPKQLQSVAKGWRLSGEHFISRRQFTSSEWKVPYSNGVTAVLPYWLREGDWILDPKKLFGFRGHLLVLRDVADGFCSPILGRGGPISVSPHMMDAIFQIFWDTEDLLIHVLVSDCSSDFYTNPVEIGVCKRDTPGSSYAVQQK